MKTQADIANIVLASSNNTQTNERALQLSGLTKLAMTTSSTQFHVAIIYSNTEMSGEATTVTVHVTG
jgi:hypothetical protein